MPKLNPNRSPKAFDDFADQVNFAARQVTADAISERTNDLNDAEAWYAAIAGLITAAGHLAQGMVELWGMDAQPLIEVLPDQFREGMKGPQPKEPTP